MMSPASLCVSLLVASSTLVVPLNGFSVGNSSKRTAVQISRSSTTEPLSDRPTKVKKQTQTLGLLTFDLDDTLYPIAKVEQEANEAFVKSMAQYGYEGLQPSDIVTAAQEIRDEVAKTDSAKAAALTHGELRLMAIRREMERVVVERKLQACADDWATTVDSLSALVVGNSKKWAKSAVHDNIVRAVSTAWEMERHHSAERHLYPEVLEVLKDIKDEHPDAIIGAVTDGRSNPLFMTFTLAPFFDFRCSWEDDQGHSRKAFFQKLESTGGDTSQLSWIYDEARYKYAELKQAADGMKMNVKNLEEPLVYPATYDDRVWIHVGDDLAFDVGGAAACGAKTIYLELDDARYKQSARHRYTSDKQAPWSTTPETELRSRYEMAKAAEQKVDVKLSFLSTLPQAINDILEAGE